MFLYLLVAQTGEMLYPVEGKTEGKLFFIITVIEFIYMVCYLGCTLKY